MASPSFQDAAEYSELKDLVKRVKLLQEEHQKLLASSPGMSGEECSKISVRSQRRHRQNCSRQYKASLDALRKTFLQRASLIQNDCLSRMRKIDSKVENISKTLSKESKGCVFKIDNSSEVDYAGNRQKVQMNEDKNASVQFVGATCCTEEHNATNASNAIFDVTETRSNIVYACYCTLGQKCKICYWQCGG